MQLAWQKGIMDFMQRNKRKSYNKKIEINVANAFED